MCTEVDLVLIMSVNPGFGGQSFIESQVKKIRDLRKICQEKVNCFFQFHLYFAHCIKDLEEFVADKNLIMLQGINPWIEVDGGVTPANAWKVCISLLSSNVLIMIGSDESYVISAIRR